MRIVVLGASGFLGHVLCEQLMKRGIDMVPVSRRWVTDDFKSIRVTVDDYRSLPLSLANSVCIHMATPGHLLGLSTNERSTVTGESLRLNLWLRDFGFQKIVFASSAVVYGDRVMRAARESDPTDNQFPYANLKILCENALMPGRDVVARIANVYGRGMSPLNVMSDILKQLIPHSESCRIEVRDLTPIRDYISATSVADALIKMAIQPVTGIFNVGSGTPHSVKEIGELMAELAGVKQPELIATEPRNIPSYLVLDPSRARSILHWNPESDMKIELMRLIDDFFLRETT